MANTDFPTLIDVFFETLLHRLDYATGCMNKKTWRCLCTPARAWPLGGQMLKAKHIKHAADKVTIIIVVYYATKTAVQ